MNHEIFIAGMSAIHVTANPVRIDCANIQPQLKSDNTQPVVEINRRIIMN